MKTAGDLKKYLEDIPDDTPLQGELQGEPNFDWFIQLLPIEETEASEYYDKQPLIISMDL